MTSNGLWYVVMELARPEERSKLSSSSKRKDNQWKVTELETLPMCDYYLGSRKSRNSDRPTEKPEPGENATVSDPKVLIFENRYHSLLCCSFNHLVFLLRSPSPLLCCSVYSSVCVYILWVVFFCVYIYATTLWRLHSYIDRDTQLFSFFICTDRLGPRERTVPTGTVIMAKREWTVTQNRRW